MKLSEIVGQYVAHKQSMGMRFSTEQRTLKSFCHAMGDIAIADVEPAPVLAFIAGTGPVTRFWHRKREVLVGFYRFATTRSYCLTSPLPTLVPKPPQPFVPYIYSHDELRRLLPATSCCEHPRSKVRGYTYRTLVLLLYGAGLRISEALALRLNDIGLVQIRESKFYRTRLVPLGPDLVSYRDTLVLLLPFVAAKLSKPLERLTPIDLSADLVRLFLTHLEESRQCSIATRNQRLAALHALARFVGERSPEHIVWCGQIRAIPFKKTTKVVIPYLDKPEMDALLTAPDRQTSQGGRDYALLLFLYNSGARADEAAQLIIRDLHSAVLFVRILGKGSKERQCPLWRATVEALAHLIVNRCPADRVFLNRCGHPMTRFGIHAMVERYAKKAQARVSSLANKRVSPHTIRHSTACHLLRAGVDINTIRAWLGHVSLDTTNIYSETDLEMKAKALATCEIASESKTNTRWREDPQLMNFLRSL